MNVQDILIGQRELLDDQNINIQNRQCDAQYIINCQYFEYSTRMNSDSYSSGIIFNNKLYKKRSESKALCLNPNCKAHRLCHADGENGLLQTFYQQHKNCKGWFHNAATLKKWHYKQEGIALGSDLQTDYLQSPIQSIYYMKKFASIQWENHLFNYFQRIKTSIEDQLDKIFIKCQMTINDHLSVNHQIYTKLQSFYENSLNSNESIEQYYDKNLKNDLKNIQNIGIITISNNGLMNRNLQSILDELKGIQNSIWNKQFNFDLLQRIKVRQKEVPCLVKYDLNITDISNRLHQMSTKFKASMAYFQANGGLNLACWFCPQNLLSTASQIKVRRQQCRSALFQHLNQYHPRQISGWALINLQNNANIPIKISLQQIKREIIAKNIKKVVIIDKQNVGPFNYNDMEHYQSYYYITVVSQNTENTVKGKYLLAQTKGKDAADILIIIAITELKKLKLEEIVLVTKDHFGETLKSIFETLGQRLILSKIHQFLNRPRSNFYLMDLMEQ